MRLHGQEKVDPIGPRRTRPRRKCKLAREHARAPARSERPTPPTHKPKTATANAG
jgi:hypothetical protein